MFESPDDSSPTFRLPNVGWLPVHFTQKSDDITKKMFENISPEAKYYFVHSFKADGDNPHCVASSQYCRQAFAAVIAKGSVIGTQFHPEKSGPAGLKLLENFVN